MSPGQCFQIAGFSFVGLDQRQCVVTVKGQASVFIGFSFSVACIYILLLTAGQPEWVSTNSEEMPVSLLYFTEG